MDRIPDDWRDALDTESLAALEAALTFVAEERRAHRETGAPAVYPPDGDEFAALRATPFEAVRVVILGQDPYHGPGQAHGLAFSVPEGVRLPPSLRNIFKEYAADLGTPAPTSGDLTAWARRGVLLLNTTLTVRDGQPASHAGRGWETVTDALIAALAKRRDGLVFVLWGAHAQKKTPLIDATRHRVLATAHPSPLSARRGFFGSKPFSMVNAHLAARGEPEIFRAETPTTGSESEPVAQDEWNFDA